MNDVPSRLVTLKLEDIHIDNEWNVRKLFGAKGAVRDASGGVDELLGFEGLVQSIRTHGQQTPVDVRVNGETAPAPPFILTSGFRRCEALRRIALEANTPPGDMKVLALVHDQDARDARIANVRENAVREDLSMSDLVYAVRALLAEGVNEKEVVPILGRSPSLVFRMVQVAKTLDPKILHEWRGALRPIAFEKMVEVARLPRQEQAKAYEDARFITSKKPEDMPAKTATTMQSIRAQAMRAGRQLARLERAGLVTVHRTNLGQESCVRAIIESKKFLPKTHWDHLSSLLLQAYDDELEKVS